MIDDAGAEGQISIGDAAELLGVSRRTIYRYLQRGLLQRAGGEVPSVFADDVEALAAKLGSRRAARWPAIAVNVLEVHAGTLDDLLSDVEIVLDATRCPLGLSDDEARSLLRSASDFADGGWPPNSEQTWARILLQLRVEDLRQIERVDEGKDGWRALLELARALRGATTGTTRAALMLAAESHIMEVLVDYLEGRFGRRASLDHVTDQAGYDRNQARRAVRKSEQLATAQGELVEVDDHSPASTVLKMQLTRFEQECRAEK